jgi:hypothetical protein
MRRLSLAGGRHSVEKGAMPNRDAALAIVVALTSALAAVLVGVLVALTPAPQRPSSRDPGPGCAEWTDGCIVCQRNGGTGVACSTPGIACTRSTLRCLRRT